MLLFLLHLIVYVFSLLQVGREHYYRRENIEKVVKTA